MSALPLDPSARSAPREPSPALRVLDGLVDRLVANQRAMAEREAERAELFAAAADVIPARAEELRDGRRRMAADLPAREVVAELATALRIGERAVQAHLTDASLLVGSFPGTLTALRDGHIDARHVAAILDAGAALGGPDLRARFEDIVLPVAARETAARLRSHARELAAKVDPQSVDRRAAAADARRTVRIYDLDDDLSRLTLDQPATLIHAIYDRLTQQAKALRTGDAAAPADSRSDERMNDLGNEERDDRVVVVTGPGGRGVAGSVVEHGSGDAATADPRTMDQLRADILADMLLTGKPSAHGNGLDAIRAVVQVTVPLAALVPDDAVPDDAVPDDAASEDPDPGRTTGVAVLPTFGPIPIGTARTLAGHAPGWERVCLDPTSGLPVAVDRYKPTARQRAYLAARDERCRFPGCRRPAHRCDIDHTRDAALGGATCICNLAHFCRGHHTIKHHTAWTVRQIGGGILEWTSPTGRHYEDRPPTTVRFVPGAHGSASEQDTDPPPF